MKNIIYRFNSISLRSRLMLAFILLIIAPLLFQGFVSLSILSKSVIDRYDSEMDYRFSQLEKRLDELFFECRAVLFDISYNKDIQIILQNKYQGKPLIEARYVVEKMLQAGKLNSGVSYSIFVYDLDGNCYTNDYLDILNFKDVINEGKIRNTHLFSCAVLTDLMRDSKYSHIFIGRPMFDISGRNRIGTVAIRIDSKHIRDIYKEVFEGSKARVTIIDNKGITVSTFEQRLSGTDALSRLGLEELADTASVVERDGNVIFTSHSDNRGWIYISDISEDMINTSRRDMQLSTNITIFIVLALIVLVLVYLTAAIVSPINRLSQSIDAVESADKAELTFKPKYEDEIGKLARSYNNMTVKLRTSVEKIKSIEKSKQRAEMKMLEAQISPHFLYNTLSSIIWLVHKDQKSQAIEMLESLAKLYQISVGSGREFITVREELCHVESYLKIQEKRYHGEFSYEVRMDDDIAEFSIIKVVLQPLVENAIYHGVRKRDSLGQILVYGRILQPDVLRFEVMDNGGFMGEDGCRRMNEALSGKLEGVLGVGVSNVIGRLRLYYGDRCKMRYEMRDEFTVVSIDIPINKEDPDV